MEDFNGNKNVSEKEEGELSSDDDGDDNQPNNIKDSSHSVQTVKEYKERQVNQSSARSKGNTSHPSRIAHKDESHRGCQKLPQGVKRRYSASDYQNQPLQKVGKQASPERNEFDPDDVMNGYYSSGEKMSSDLWCMNNREASESENHRRFEKASKPIKRRNTVSSDLRHRLSRSAAQKPSSSRRSHTRSCLKSSSGKEFYLSKYKKLWDQRKPPVKPECKYRGLQIQVSDRGRKEVERKVKERSFGQPMEKRHRSNHSSLRKDRFMEPREMLHSSHHLVTSTQMYSNEVCINYPPQDSNYPPTPGIPHRTLDFGINPTYPIHQNNGYSTFPPGTHVKLYQHPPVSLPTTQLQRRSHDGSSSDVIGQTLRSIRSHESMQLYSQNATFSSNIHNYNSTSALNGPHVKPEYIHVESVSTSIFNRLGPEVRNGLSDIQPGLDKKNPRESFPETAGNMCIRNTSNRNQLVPEYAMAHNTTNQRTETTTPRPVSGSESNRKLNENLTKTKAEREKEELKKYASELEERIQRMREQVFKEKKNNCNSSNPYVPTTVLHTQFKIDKTAKGKPQSRFRIDRTSNAKPENEFRTISWTAVSDVSILYVNSSNNTLEQKEQMNPLDFRLPQIDDETTADVNLASSLSESQSKFTEPQEETKPNETNRRHVYLSPLSMFDTYRDKQASTKGITETHDKSHVMSLAETQEKETCNKQAFALEITETNDEGHVMSSVANSNKQAYVKENTETRNENVMSPVESQERETCNKQASLEISETHDVVSSAETQEKEACNNQVFAMEIGKICKDNVMSSAGDGNRQASAKEITKTRDKNNVISPAEAWETCNKKASALESTETNEISYAADLHGACTTQAKEITESHVEGNVMSSAANGNKQASAKENTETHDEGCVMSPVETHAQETCNSQALKSTEMHDKEACNNPALESTKIHVKGPVVSSAAETQVCSKQDSATESTETHDESHVMGPTEAQKEAACNKQVSALVINETHDKDCVMSSAAGTQEDGHKQDSAVEITETHDGGYVMSPAETQDGGASNKQVCATGSIKIDNESGVMSCAADLQEVCNKNISAKEITDTHEENDVMSAAETEEEKNCNKHTSTMERTEIYNESFDELCCSRRG